MEYESLETGATSIFTKVVSDADITQFAAITGDSNPVHLSDEAAISRGFGGRIAHGMLVAGFISAAIVNGVPGSGAIYLSQSLRFRHPVRPGDVVTTRLEIIELMPRTRRVRLATVCKNQDDVIVLDGEAVVLVPDSQPLV